MKKSFLFSYALAGMMLASCSSSDDIATTGTHGFAEDGTGYVKVSLNLPTRSASSTRGVNDATADGTSDEYKVNNAILIIFAGNSEADATFQSAYDLTGSVKEDIDNDQITSQYTVTQEVKSVSGAKNIYAFVVLNSNDAFDVTTTNGLKVNGTEISTTENFSDFSKKSIDKTIDLTSKGIMMTNALVTTTPGTATLTSPTCLANVTTNVYPTQAEAEANPAADIFVERMAAKVTLTDASTKHTSTGTITGGGVTKEFTFALTGWELANTNSKSYISRQWDVSWNSYKSSGDGVAFHPELNANEYRFAGTTLIKAENGNPSGNYYRTYFGKDANYNSDASFTDHPSSLTELVMTTPLTSGESTYCYENTFDVAQQTVKNTTVALVKMKITPESWTATDFYTKDGNKNVIYSEDDAQKLVAKQLLSDFTAADLKTKYFSSISDAGTITAAISFYTGTSTTPSEAGTQNYSVKLTFTKGDGTTTDANVGATDEIGGKNVLETLKTNIKISKYKDCYAYYKVLIKHFGDELTPWNNVSNTTTTPADFLGRYGVLRNNWYDISVTGVSGLGDATPGDLDVNNDPTKDDKTTSFISCRINVLSWAKRTQSTVLGN